MKVPTQLAADLKALIDGKCGGDSPVYADLHDIYEICVWYIEFIESSEGTASTSCDLKKAVLELDINLIMHMEYHIKSLRGELKKLSDLVGDE